MRIYITETYRGERSNGQFISAGEYDHDDPILQNAAMYFVENGFAVVVAEEPPADEQFNFEAEPETGTAEEISPEPPKRKGKK